VSLRHSSVNLNWGPPSASQVLERNLSPLLRGVRDGALKHDFGIEHAPQSRVVLGVHVFAPAGQGLHFHRSLPGLLAAGYAASRPSC
jgi:hypothetical protein